MCFVGLLLLLRLFISCEARGSLVGLGMSIAGFLILLPLFLLWDLKMSVNLAERAVQALAVDGSVVDVSVERYGDRVVFRVKLFGVIPLEVLRSVVELLSNMLQGYRVADVALETPAFVDLVVVFERR